MGSCSIRVPFWDGEIGKFTKSGIKSEIKILNHRGHKGFTKKTKEGGIGVLSGLGGGCKRGIFNRLQGFEVRTCTVPYK
ncbi:MAG: hypothetical protein JWO13_2179 [Acidobacteriales bacterium]|nr:hypothetical protein [Terriglobales bacterium]